MRALSSFPSITNLFPSPGLSWILNNFFSSVTPDTGLRSKPKNVGLGDCKGPKFYGIPQCEVNFTQADLNVQNLPNPNITGDFQATEAWPFKELSDQVAQTMH